jgi:cytochrome P450
MGITATDSETGTQDDDAVELEVRSRAQAPLLSRLRRWVTNFLTSPRVLRLVFALLRGVAPVLVLGKRALVTRHADVISLLERDQEFTIAEVNAARTARDNGPFVLGMDRGLEHDREKALLNQVMQRADGELVRTIVREEGERCLARTRGFGQIELVQGLSRAVPLRLIERYFGVSSPAEGGMDDWLSALFHDLFLNQADEPQVMADAVTSFQRLRPHLAALIEKRRNQASMREDDVLGRMLALQSDPAHRSWLNDDAVCRNISGLIIGALETTSKAVVLVIDELLRRPAALEEAVRAALRGDVQAVRGSAYEALRFNPFVPVLVRHCRNETPLGRAGRVIPPGTLVYAATFSAMFDSAAVEEPREFRANRAIEYLHFGYGLHRCQGRLVNDVQVPELVALVLKLPNLRRAPGSRGQVAYAGPFPERFVLEFDPS